VGALHACALLNDETVKCWGSNDYGQLGLGDRNGRGDEPNEMGDMLPPVDLGKDKKATALAAGGYFTCALLNDGHVKCWGVNDSGQLGLGDNKTYGDEPDEMGDNLPEVQLW
jgi:alpha-tubulin suppressor-like RCC1 family protein